MATEGDQEDNWRMGKIKGLEDLPSLAQGSRITKQQNTYRKWKRSLLCREKMKQENNFFGWIQIWGMIQNLLLETIKNVLEDRDHVRPVKKNRLEGLLELFIVAYFDKYNVKYEVLLMWLNHMYIPHTGNVDRKRTHQIGGRRAKFCHINPAVNLKEKRSVIIGSIMNASIYFMHCFPWHWEIWWWG